jgi:uncharacterized protein YjbI with pentapeptide repeats
VALAVLKLGMEEYPFRELLQQGPVAWNVWRRDNVHVVPNFDGADLSGWVLDGVNLDDAVLFEAVLANASLVGATLRRAVLQGADLRGANLRSADLSDADLSGTWARDPTVRLAWPDGANLRDASLHDTLFARTLLRGCQFSGARLNRTVFSDVNLSLAQGSRSVECQKAFCDRFSCLTPAALLTSTTPVLSATAPRMWSLRRSS